MLFLSDFLSIISKNPAGFIAALAVFQAIHPKLMRSDSLTVFDLSFIPPLFGFDNEQVVTTATSDAAGIIGGDGNDKVTNAGSLIVQSDATVDIDELSIGLLGLGSDVNRTAMAAVTGITGNHGNDYIENSGQLDATANGRLDLLSISVDLVGGATDIDGKNEALANAVGIDGGDGGLCT